jgi:tetratricopeptide (TPR) repeat protein
MLLTKGLGAAAAANPAVAQQWVNYGQKVYAQRDYAKAQQAFSTAIKNDGRNVAAWKGLGNTLYMKGDKANALKYYKYALALNPSDTALAGFVAKMGGGAAAAPASGPLAAANREYAARQYAAAAGHYQEAVTQNPTDAKAWQGLGNARYAQQDRAGAMQAYNRALELNPSNAALRAFVDKAGGSAQAAGGPTDWVQPLWRSAILPGWGQGYNGQELKGWIMGGTEVALMTTTILTFMAGESAHQQYISLTDPKADYDTPFATWESMAQINHTAYALFGAVYLYGLVDAILNAKPKSAYRAEFGGNEVAALDVRLNAMGTPMVQAKLLEF